MGSPPTHELAQRQSERWPYDSARFGAEESLGNGDLLFKDIAEPVRLQAPFLPAAGRRRLFAKSG